MKIRKEVLKNSTCNLNQNKSNMKKKMDIQVQKVTMNLKVNKIEKCSEMK